MYEYILYTRTSIRLEYTILIEQGNRRGADGEQIGRRVYRG